jgi:hypothetical protein
LADQQFTVGGGGGMSAVPRSMSIHVGSVLLEIRAIIRSGKPRN